MNYDHDRTAEDYGEPQETEGIVATASDYRHEFGSVLVDMKDLKVYEEPQCKECNDEGEIEMMTLGWNNEPSYWMMPCEGYAHEMQVNVVLFDEGGLRNVVVHGV